MLDIINDRQQIDRNLIYTGVGNFGAAAISILFWLALTHLLNVEEYGIFNYVISIGMLLSFSALMGAVPFITTFLAKGNNEIRNSVKSLVLLTAGGAALVTLSLQTSKSLLLFIPAVVVLEIAIAELLGDKRYKAYSILYIVHKTVQSGLAVVFFFAYGIEGLLIGYGLGYMTALPIFLKGLRLTNPIPVLSKNWQFLIHGYSMSMVNIITLFSDKLVIAPLFGFHTLGLYQFGSQVLTFAGIFPTILFNYLLPQEASGNNKTQLRPIAIGLSILLAILFVILIPSVVRIAFPKFEESILAAQLISIGIVPMTVTFLIYSVLLGSGKSKYVFIASIIFVASQYPLLYTLGNSFGIVGMSAGTVLALSLQCGFLVIVYRHQNIHIKDSTK